MLNYDMINVSNSCYIEWKHFDCCSVLPQKLLPEFGFVFWVMFAGPSKLWSWCMQINPFQQKSLAFCLAWTPLRSSAAEYFPWLCADIFEILLKMFFKTLSKMFQRNLLCCLLQKVVRGGGGPALAKNFDNRKFWLVDTNASSSLPSSKICNF